MACECCNTKGGTIPTQQVETVVQVRQEEDPHSADILQQLACNSFSTLSMHFSVDGETIIPVAAMGSQSSSAAHLSLGIQDMKLLRGTNLVQVLSSFGSELRCNSLNQSLTPEEAAKLYRKSFQVNKFDYFISHCWQDERFPKVVALYIHKNLHVAMIFSTIVAIILTALTRLKVLPVVAEGDSNVIDHFPWALCGGGLSFFFVLFTWQHVAFLVRPRIYFLDKFCVHQGDDDLKRLGVQSFAGFVAASDRMLLLWTTQYFTRLWCTLELAALVKSRQGLAATKFPLEILPLKLAKVSFMTWVTVFLVYAIVQFNRILGRPIPDIGILGVALLVSAFVLIRALRVYAHDRKAMHHQIENFSVQEAKCSDERDRRWVERSMLRWFADLELCNLHIRQAVREQAEERLGPERHIPTKLLMPVFLVNLFNDCDYIAGGYYDSLRKSLAGLGWAAFTLSIVPVGYRLALCFTQQRKWFLELLINTSLSLGLVLLAVSIYVTTHFVVAKPEVNAVVLCIPFLEIVVVAWLQRRSFGRC